MKRLLIFALLLMCCAPFASALPIVPCSAPTRADTNPDNACDQLVGMPRFQYGNVIDTMHLNYPGVNVTGIKWQYYNSAQTGVGLSDCQLVLNMDVVSPYVVEHYPNDTAAVYMGPKMFTDGACSIAYGNDWGYGSYWYVNLTSGVATPTANFTGTPRQGTGPLNVAFTDTSGNASSWNWSVSPATGWYVTSGTINSQDIGINFVTSGNYTITHGVSNGIRSDIETKTDYIWIYDSNATKTTAFRTMDILSGNTIHNTTINLYDIQNTSWTNTTGSPNGRATITTLAGHTINAYASAWGYGDADLLAQVARDEITEGGAYTILMSPAMITYNNTAGNLTLTVTVRADDTLQLLEGAKVDILLAGGRQGMGYTNSAGTAYFTGVANNTDVRVSVTKVGYGDSTVFDNTGPGSGGTATKNVLVLMYPNYVTPTPVVTTLPGGGYPTPTVTVDPYPCVGDGSAQDTANCQRKQGEMGADLIAVGPELLAFFILLTFVGGLKLMTKK